MSPSRRRPTALFDSDHDSDLDSRAGHGEDGDEDVLEEADDTMRDVLARYFTAGDGAGPGGEDEDDDDSSSSSSGSE